MNLKTLCQVKGARGKSPCGSIFRLHNISTTCRFIDRKLITGCVKLGVGMGINYKWERRNFGW